MARHTQRHAAAASLEAVQQSLTREPTGSTVAALADVLDCERELSLRWIAMIAIMLWMTPADAQNIEMGKEIFERCSMCHDVGPQAKNRQGPHLNELVGRRAGSLPDFPYSAALREAGDGGLVWTPATLAQFIMRPKHFEPGNGMIFPGLKNPADVADVVAYIVSRQTPEQIAIQTGAALAETYCGACHATDLEGLSPHPEAPPFRELHLRYDVTDLMEGLVEGLSSGHPDMPEFEFEPEQATAIIAYLQSLR